jgi:methyltransferase FkbM-like protein
MVMKEIVQTLSLLTPYDLCAERKVRIGNPTGDGGYVFLDRLRTSQKVYTFGIGSDVTLDLDFATRGHEVFLMDHTISEPPAEHERFCFISEGIAGVSDPARGLFSLAEHLSRRRDDDSDLILKMDVEGAEWETLSAATPDVLCRFEQIVFEAHGLTGVVDGAQRAKVRRVLANLDASHTLFHVHANNATPLGMVEGLPIPDLLELSYVRTDLVTRTPSTTLYPTALDMPNTRRGPDILLSFFPFLPCGPAGRESVHEQMLRAGEQLERQVASLSEIGEEPGA